MSTEQRSDYSLSVKPKISLIIPVYNAERTIARCLDSIFSQTFSSYEIIVINDGSTDQSLFILEDYSSKHPGIIHIINQANHGAAYSRNRGIDCSNGVYLAFIDNDDWIDSTFLETLFDATIKTDADIVLSGYRRPDERGIVRQERILSPNSGWSCFEVEAAWGKLYKRSFVIENSLSFLNVNISEDLAFTLPAVTLSNNKVILPYCGYNWFLNPSSVSNTLQKTSSGLEFEYALNKISRLLNVDSPSHRNPLLDYLFVRHIVWFLFWTSEGDSSKVIRENCSRYISWLDAHLPTWRRNAVGAPLHPSGDSLATRLITWLFMVNDSLALKLILAYSNWARYR